MAEDDDAQGEQHGRRKARRQLLLLGLRRMLGAHLEPCGPQPGHERPSAAAQRVVDDEQLGAICDQLLAAVEPLKASKAPKPSEK